MEQPQDNGELGLKKGHEIELVQEKKFIERSSGLSMHPLRNGVEGGDLW